MSENNLKCRIVDAMNTYNPALAIIISKGYKVFVFPDERENFYGDYWAIKENRDFVAADPLRLLGIITLWETFGDNWQEHAKFLNNYYDDIATRAFPNDVSDVEKLSNEEFLAMVEDFRLFLNRVFCQDILPENPTPLEFYNIVSSFYKEDFIQSK